MKNFFIKNKITILYILTFVSLISFINTIRKGLLNGCDFQWQPSVLFWQGVNHYEKFIDISLIKNRTQLKSTDFQDLLISSVS